MVIQVLPSKVVNINYHAIIIGQCNTQVEQPLGSWGVLVLFFVCNPGALSVPMLLKAKANMVS